MNKNNHPTPRDQPHRLGGIHRLNYPTTFRGLTHYFRLYTPISYLSQNLGLTGFVPVSGEHGSTTTNFFGADKGSWRSLRQFRVKLAKLRA